MINEQICISCKKKTANMSGTAAFPCPNCAKTKIIRCTNCRANAVAYTCSDCQFTGPN